MPETKNKYVYPVDFGEPSYKKSPAHSAAYAGGRFRHAADFICPVGTPVRAALGGTVADVKQDSRSGGASERRFAGKENYVEIRHKNGEYSIYEHLKYKGARVRKGERVKAGQVIGYSGKTGWIAGLGPHLHFDVHKYFGPGLEDYRTIRILWKK